VVRRVPMCVPICVPMCVPKQVHIYDGSGTAGRQGILFNRLIYIYIYIYICIYIYIPEQS